MQEQVITMEGSVSMLRCLYCGEQIDQVVMANRTIRKFSTTAVVHELMKYSRNGKTQQQKRERTQHNESKMAPIWRVSQKHAPTI